MNEGLEVKGKGREGKARWQAVVLRSSSKPEYLYCLTRISLTQIPHPNSLSQNPACPNHTPKTAPYSSLY